jgi:hypothetical protein
MPEPSGDRIKLTIDRTKVAEGPHTDFPVLVEIVDSRLIHSSSGGIITDESGSHIQFLGEDQDKPVPSEIVAYDPVKGTVKAWVAVPSLSGTEDTVLFVACSSSEEVQQRVSVWDEDYRIVIHDLADQKDSASGVPLRTQKPFAVVPHHDRLDLREAITIEAWVDPAHPVAETLQPVISKWQLNSDLDAFSAYDAGSTNGLDTTGFFGAVFDGRYIYFSPQHDLSDRHGKALRYDTHGDFLDSNSWEGYDAGATAELNTKGYYGAVFDGRYVIYPPRRDPENFHSRVLRFDTQGGFRDPDSWDAYEASGTNSSQSAAFDGRYIYFCPGQKSIPKQSSDEETDDSSPTVTGMSSDQLLVSSGDVMRYDTQTEFADPAAWQIHDVSQTGGLNTRDYDGAVFDGRYIYFAPLSYGAPLRYDTECGFQDRSAWEAYDALSLGMKRCVGAVFDGQYIYYVPYGATEYAIRYDTRESFADDGSWGACHLPEISDLNVLGFDGAFFDGRHIYYIPYWDEGVNFHGVTLRYDIGLPFSDPESWTATDSGVTDGMKTVGFNGGATDGRYLYYGAWMDGTGFPERIIGNGRVLRYDTTGENASFSLRYSDLGHNGGLCAALPGTRFLVNTDRGVVSVASNKRPLEDRHHLVGVYDGQSISLYINGQLVNAQVAGGEIVNNGTDVTLGGLLGGSAAFQGQIEELRISSSARDAGWIRTQYINQSNPTSFCRIAP